MSRIDVTVGVRNAAFRSGLEEVRASARQFTGDIKSMFAGAFATGAIISGIQGVVMKGDEIGDLAQRFRISAEELQRLGMSAEFSGTSMETVARSMNKLRLAQASAVAGNEELQATFSAMGISAEALNGMGTEELYYRVADAVAVAGSETAKLQILTSIFGNRMAGELLPMLEQGGAKMRELGGSAAIMSNETVASLSAAKDEITRIQATLTVALGTLVGVVIMPLLNSVKSLGAAWGGIFSYMADSAGETAGILADLFSGNFTVAKDRVLAFGEFTRDALARALEGTKAELDAIWKDTDQPDAAAPSGETGNAPDSKAAEETAKLEAQLEAERERNARAAMSRAERINALQEEHNKLLAEAAALSGDEQTKKLIEAEKAGGELQREQRTAAEEEVRERERIEAEAARKADQEQKERERKQEELARAKEQESDVDERNRLAAMSPEQKAEYLRSKQQRLFGEAQTAADSGDDLTAVRKRTEAKALEREINQEKPEAPGSRSVLTVDSLRRIGGGGGIGPVSDAAQRERERHTRLLERIARAVETEVPQGTAPATYAP